VLRIWSCLHHCQTPSWWGLLPPPQEFHPALDLRPRFSACQASLGSLFQQSSLPQCIGILIKTLVVPIFGAKVCIKMHFFVFKIHKKIRGSRPPNPRGGRGDICSHPSPCPTARCWCPSASSRLATSMSMSMSTVDFYIALVRRNSGQ